MTMISPAFTAARHLAPGLSLFGLAVVAGLSWAPAPAAAATNDVPASCQFQTIPGGGEGLRYDECMRRTACNQIADAAGRTIYEAGCFGVSPKAPRLAALARPTH
ncbi:hypothetical protein [Bosea sp. (in: a-proteobacteria)]|uniref:hypothetical protein n=1 Tax=Bosea sp. (in: a-proteobacteria) TaxID=1871050 RepID=UPI00260B44AF|nr:hypothetical protein [Bosea sp. (in: a-proteobacteria)]MCO5093414.1 hypothetical protein [Bosea sp. (in: a-proteobacteria)]